MSQQFNKVSNNSTDSSTTSDWLILRSGFKVKRKNQEFKENSCPEVAMEKVFGNPMLLKEILTFLILNHDKKTSSIMSQNFRLVQKWWLDITTSVLKKSGKPLIVLNLDEKNSLEESDEVKKNGKRLDQFVSRFGVTSRLESSFLPFKLNLALEYFREENQQSLISCLASLGKELVELQVTFPKDGGSMSFVFPSLNLPLLRKISFHLSPKDFQKRQGDHDKPCFGNNTNSLLLLKFLLDASDGLRQLVFPWSVSNEDLVPANFEILQLQQSVSCLHLKVPLKSKSIEVLFNNQLPNLKHLEINLHKIPLTNDMLFRMLYRFRKTLTYFEIRGPVFVGLPISPTILRFPQMENLKCLYISSTACELEAHHTSNLQTFLPKIQELGLLYQNKSLLTKWVQNSKFEYVERLGLCFILDEIREGQNNHFDSLNLEMIEQVHLAFPNVTRLTLAFNISDLSCLKYVFQKMLQVKDLAIDLKGKLLETNKYYFDSILLGLPVQLVKSLREHSDFLTSFALDFNKEPSILNLAELSILILSTDELPVVSGPYRPENDELPLLSNLLFYKGLLKMPKLTHLWLSKKFQVCKKMAELWNAQSRTMTYNYEKKL